MSYARTSVALVAGLLVSTAAFSREPQSSSSEERQKRCHAVQIRAVGSTSQSTQGKAKKKSQGRHRFSAREILDLRLDVLLRQSDQSGLVEVAVYTPSGHLYETLKAEVDPEADDPSPGRSSYRGRRTRVVTAKLPIAGSFITRRSIYGEWRAEVHLDGDEAPCAQPTTFILEP